MADIINGKNGYGKSTLMDVIMGYIKSKFYEAL